MDVDKHSLGIDVGDLEIRSFPETQAKGVDDFQTCPVVRGDCVEMLDATERDG